MNYTHIPPLHPLFTQEKLQHIKKTARQCNVHNIDITESIQQIKRVTARPQSTKMLRESESDLDSEILNSSFQSEIIKNEKIQTQKNSSSTKTK
jgi:hypothetical protein